MRELDKVLDENEKIFWEGKPKFWPFLLAETVRTVIIGLVWTAFLAPFFAVRFYDKSIQDIWWKLDLFLIPFALVSIWLVIGVPIYKLLLYKNLYYAITNKRVVLQKGVIGRDFEYIDFDQITNAEVNVGFWDKVVGKGSGSILVSSAGSITYTNQGQLIARPYTISNIDDPYTVFKFFKKVSHAVKTDIHFPNKYRPKTNPGYGTRYNPQK